MGDILDGEVVVAELAEADIEAEIELVTIIREVPPGKLVGAHVSMSNGIARAVINAASIGKRSLLRGMLHLVRWLALPLSCPFPCCFHRMMREAQLCGRGTCTCRSKSLCAGHPV